MFSETVILKHGETDLQISVGENTGEATALLCEFLNNIFDSFNTRADEKCFSRLPIVPNSKHFETWDNALTFLKAARFITKGTGETVPNSPSLKNLIFTIEGIQRLWNVLHHKYGFTVLQTRFLNQDPLENFFGQIRSHGRRRVMPTPLQFKSSFVTCMINSHYKQNKNCNTNCEPDEVPLLFTLLELVPFQIQDGIDDESQNDNNENNSSVETETCPENKSNSNSV